MTPLDRFKELSMGRPLKIKQEYDGYYLVGYWTGEDGRSAACGDYAFRATTIEKAVELMIDYILRGDMDERKGG